MSINESWHGSSDHNPTVRMVSRPIHQNRSERYGRRVNFDYDLISDFETIGDWVTAGGVQAVDLVNFKQGNQGIKWTSINTVNSRADRTIALDCLGKHFTIWVYFDDITKLDTLQFYWRVTDVSWTKYFNKTYNGVGYFLQNGWNPITICRGECGINGAITAVDWANVNLVRISVISVAGQTVNVTFDDYRAVKDRFPGMVTLRFDDTIASQSTVARPYMDKYGFRGVAATIVSYVNGVGRMTLGNLSQLQDLGWDIVLHSSDHLTAISAGGVEKVLREGQRWLVDNGFYKGSRFFIIPYTEWNPAVMSQIQKYFLATQAKSLPTELSVIPPFPYHMTFYAVADADAVATVTAKIDTAIQYNGWLTLLFHDIGAGGYPTANFQAIMNYLYNNNVLVVTLSDIFDELISTPRLELLEFGVQGVITPNVTTYPCPGGGIAASTATEIAVPISRKGILKSLRVKQRVASGLAGRTDVYKVRVNGVDTAITCTLNNALAGDNRVNFVVVNPSDVVSMSLTSNSAADVSADVSATIELETQDD